MNTESDILKRLLIKESPLLFLGAGFSIGAKLSTGEEFPKGDQLKGIIIERFLKLNKEEEEYKELLSYNLSKVCQYAKNVKDAAYFNDFVSDLLRNSKPNSYHKILTLYNWRKIYTTNIDDIIETVYREQNKEILLQNLSRKSTLHKDCTEYLKLHGCVNNPSEGLVFSTDEYVESMARTMDYRFNSLCIDINSEDFIFIGSEFEEINIDYYLKLYESSGYKSSRGRLVFVNPKPSLYLRSKIKKLGAILLEWTGEQFLEFLNKTVIGDKKKEEIPKIQLNKIGFEILKRENFVGQSMGRYDSNLYLGFEPTWQDIFYDWDFKLSELFTEFSTFKRYVEENKSTGIFAVCGKAFSGKSVFIKRLAVELTNDEYEVCSFNGRFFSYYNFYQHIIKSDRKKFALVIDDASYHYKAIRQLSKFNFYDKKLIIVTTSRPFYHYRKRYHFIEENYKEYSIETNITESYAKGIVHKLEEKGYLGELRKYNTLDDKISQIVQRSDIFSLLSYITQGNGFKDRMLKEIIPLLKREPLVNDLLLKTAIFEELDLPYFPRELVTYIYSEKTPHLLALADDFLKFNSKGDIQFRAKFYAKRLINANGKKGIIESIRDILIFISPQISEFSQRAGNSYWCEIQEALTKQRLLRTVFDLSKAQIKELLLSIQSYYNDNSHFWLQLGIAEQSLNEFEKALNHFKQAEALNPRSYIIQHAIGRNYMKHANYIDTGIIASSYHEMGEKILVQQIENQEEFVARAFSTHSYLNEELKYIEKYNQKVSNTHLKKLFNYLKKIIDKDPEDVMAKHMSNHFYKFLKRTNKLNIVNINMRDLSNFKSFFQDYNISMDDLIEDQDFI